MSKNKKESEGELWITTNGKFVVIREDTDYWGCNVYETISDAVTKSDDYTTTAYTQRWLHKCLSPEKTPEYYL